MVNLSCSLDMLTYSGRGCAWIYNSIAKLSRALGSGYSRLGVLCPPHWLIPGTLCLICLNPLRNLLFVKDIKSHMSESRFSCLSKYIYIK